jgi:small multidrug resistance pump
VLILVSAEPVAGTADILLNQSDGGAPAMRTWALLLGAILTEVTGTLSLRASQDHLLWLVVVAAGYLASFLLLTRVLRAGMPVGVAYGIWGALGTAITAVIASVVFGDPFTAPMVIGIVLIIAGVLLVEFGSHRAEGAVR